MSFTARALFAYAIATVPLAPALAVNEYTPLLKAKKYAEAERAASAKLAADPDNADALVARVEIITSQGQEKRLDEALKLAEQCIAAHPQRSECQQALGSALGTKAVMGGMLSAMGYATKIRDAFAKAVELDPQNLEARFALLQYYLQAPSIVGGGKGKAAPLIAATAKINADAAKLMQAALDLGDDKVAAAEAAALAVNPGASDVLADNQRDMLVGLGTEYIKNKKFADGERIFREMLKRFPDSEWGSYGLGRTFQEQSRHAEAIAHFEKALAIEPGAHMHYRIAQCWQALGDKPRAMTAFEKALAFKPALQKKQKSDAEERLKALRA